MFKISLFIVGLLVLSCSKEKPAEIQDEYSFAKNCSADYLKVEENRDEFRKEYTGKLTCENQCDNENGFWLKCYYIDKEFYMKHLNCLNIGCFWAN